MARGFLSRSTNDWECERGFRKNISICIAAHAPANAHVDYSGDSWTSDAGIMPTELFAWKIDERSLA